MSLSNQKDNGYSLTEGSKIVCKTCGSILSKTSWSSHIKTKKHLGEPVIKQGEKYQKMRLTTSTIRQKQIEEIGLEKVREKERLKKAKERANKKAGVAPRIRKEPSIQSEENKKLDELKHDIKATESEMKDLPKNEITKL